MMPVWLVMVIRVVRSQATNLLAGEDALVGRGWKRDPELMGDNYATWVKDGKVMVTFRGSQDGGDVSPDAGIAIGKERKR